MREREIDTLRGLFLDLGPTKSQSGRGRIVDVVVMRDLGPTKSQSGRGRLELYTQMDCRCGSYEGYGRNHGARLGRVGGSATVDELLHSLSQSISIGVSS